MATIFVKLNKKADQLKLIEAIGLLKGVKSIGLMNDEEISDQLIVDEMLASRKSGEGNKQKTLDFLNR